VAGAGRVALVTGSTSGIGRAVAVALAAAGHEVAVHGREEERAAKAAAEVAAESGGPAFPVHGDVADPAAVSSLMREVRRRHDHLDVLVVNAGVHEAGLLGMTGAAAVSKLFEVNAMGAVHTLQAAVRLLRRGTGPSVVLVSSIMGRRGGPGQAVYSATKAALLGLTAAAAKELGPAGIRVNAVAPGYIDTGMLATLDGEERARAVAATPLGRLGAPADVAAVVAFLAGERAAFVTGQVIGVDGGLVL
jgi:3-oxoacyl-[acyl-carrier protein] reductase